jgi:mono/diheme cytochrome c family protein
MDQSQHASGMGARRAVVLAAAIALSLPPFVLRAANLPPVPASSTPREEAVSARELRERIEEDWLQAPVDPVTTRSDAAGACDGVKDGKYGFHTGLEANPWWQVDLEAEARVARIVAYNRLDYPPGLHNADRLRILTSSDGKSWTLRHDQSGRHFGGISGGGPLEVEFPGDGIPARFVRLLIPGESPVFFHLDEVEVYGPGPQAMDLALHRPCDQSSLSPWSTSKVHAPREYPIRDSIDRSRRVAAHLAESGADLTAPLRDLQAVEGRLRALPAGAGEAERRSLYLEARWIGRRISFSDPLLAFDRLLFVKRFTQETYPDICLNHMPWVSRPGGDICVLAVEGGLRALADPGPNEPGKPAARLRSILNGALGPGHVHGMDLGWDAGRIVFGYARARSDRPPEGWLDRARSYHLRRTEEPIHLFEVGTDGGGLRQLTAGEWSDLDPTYLASGEIAFVSERCGTSLQCNEFDKDETSCNLYACGPTGGGIRRLGVNKDGDYLPHALDSGLIGYTRWEYHERSWAFIQALWAVRPDGTGAEPIFKQHLVDPWSLEDVRSIPGSSKLIAIAAGHHTLAVGPLVVVDASGGINDSRGLGIVTPNSRPPEGGMDGVPVPEGGVAEAGGFYSTPWALSEKRFLVSYTPGDRPGEPAGYGIYLVDVCGTRELIYRDREISSFTPVPLRPRPRPPAFPPAIDPQVQYATCALSVAGYGSEGLEPGRIRYLRIAEPIGWPYDNQHGGKRYGEDHRYGGPGSERKNLINWTPVRILGDVPVERDGSAHFIVPAQTAVYFQLLDEDHAELRRMRSFISFQGGEWRACAGCHERRLEAPPAAAAPSTLALLRAPSAPVPPPWGDRPVSFLRDIQPVLDRRCVSCHGGLKPAGGLDFSGGLTTHDGEVAGYGYNRAFETILEHGLVERSPVRAQDASITPPGAYGSRKSKLLQALGRRPHDLHLKLSEEERLRLTMWIDANAPYHDDFVDKRPERPAYDLALDQRLLADLAAIHQRRCASCHRVGEVTRLDWIDLREPARSRFLAAPLEREAGGSGKCGSAVYQGAGDPDCRAALALVRAAVEKSWARPRRDLRALDRPAMMEEAR